MNDNDNPEIIPRKPGHPKPDRKNPKPSIPRKIPNETSEPNKKPVEVPPIKPNEVPVRETEKPN